MITISETIKTTWKEFVGHFPAWAKLVLPVAVIGVIYALLDEWYGASSLAPGQLPLAAPGGWPPGIYFAAVIIFAIAYAWMNVVVILNADRILGGKQIDADTTYKLGWQKVVNAFFVSVMYGLVVVGGLLLLIVPGIIFAMRYSLALQAAVLEDKRGWNAMRRSAELTKGRYASVFSLFFVPNLVFGIGVALLATIPSIVASFVGSVIAPGSSLDSFAIRATLSSIDSVMSALTFPLAVIVSVLVYRAFRDSVPTPAK